MAENHFLLPLDSYQRKIDPIGEWEKQTSWYLSKQLNISFEDAKRRLAEKQQQGVIQAKDPNVVFFFRKQNGDRVKTSTTLSKYLKTILRTEKILAPTGTSYLNPKEYVSLIVKFLDENVAIRKRYKKLAQKNKDEGDMESWSYNHNTQDNAKRDNNAVSGNFAAEGTAIRNPSAHSTLTSTTRSIASLSNMSNERIIEGNRHYYHPDIVLNNITSICTHSDQAKIEQTIFKYGLNYPSVKDTMACIRRSTDFYFRDRKALKPIQDLVERLEPWERAAVVYTGDLYHLRVLNESFIRNFVTQLSRRVTSPTIEPEARSRIREYDEFVRIMSHQINLSIMKGKGHDYEKLTDEDATTVYLTCENVTNTITSFRDLLEAFFLTENSPPTMATVPKMVRRAVVLSDTDSTMFSVDSWVTWYFGKLNFKDEGFAVAGAVAYIATQCIAHILAQFSANMGVERKRILTLSMKPEYGFPVFAQTSVAKHYYTAKIIQEGSVYKDIDLEIKGVHMKNSTISTDIIQAAADRMEASIRTVMAGEELSLEDLLRQTIDIETTITQSLLSGDTHYLKRIRIKEKSAYKVQEVKPSKTQQEQDEDDIDRSNYRQYLLWDKVFGPTHGRYGEPPYDAIIVPLKFKSKKTISDWLEKLEDREFASLLANFFIENDMKSFGQIFIPQMHCVSHGIPKVLLPMIDTRRTVLACTQSFRNIIESYGYFLKTDVLVMEQVVLK